MVGARDALSMLACQQPTEKARADDRRNERDRDDDLLCHSPPLLVNTTVQALMAMAEAEAALSPLSAPITLPGTPENKSKSKSKSESESDGKGGSTGKGKSKSVVCVDPEARSAAAGLKFHFTRRELLILFRWLSSMSVMCSPDGCPPVPSLLRAMQSLLWSFRKGLITRHEQAQWCALNWLVLHVKRDEDLYFPRLTTSRLAKYFRLDPAQEAALGAAQVQLFVACGYDLDATVPAEWRWLLATPARARRVAEYLLVDPELLPLPTSSNAHSLLPLFARLEGSGAEWVARWPLSEVPFCETEMRRAQSGAMLLREVAGRSRLVFHSDWSDEANLRRLARWERAPWQVCATIRARERAARRARARRIKTFVKQSVPTRGFGKAPL